MTCTVTAVYRGWLIWRELERQRLLHDGVSGDLLPEEAAEHVARMARMVSGPLRGRAVATRKLRPRTPLYAVAIALLAAVSALLMLGNLAPLMGVASQGMAGPAGGVWLSVALATLGFWVLSRGYISGRSALRFLRLLCELGSAPNIGIK